MFVVQLKSGTVIDSENTIVVQLTRIESRTWAFQRAINQGRASLLTSPKWCPDAQFVVFFAEISTKNIQVCYKVSFCLQTHSGKVVVVVVVVVVKFFNKKTLSDAK